MSHGISITMLKHKNASISFFVFALLYFLFEAYDRNKFYFKFIISISQNVNK